MTEVESQAAALLETYVAKYKPLSIAANLAWWEASISGKDEDFQKRKDAENKLVELHSDVKVFAEIKALRSAPITDPVLKRRLEITYYNFLPYQADPELSKQIVSLEADVEQIFNTHRSLVDGKCNWFSINNLITKANTCVLNESTMKKRITSNNQCRRKCKSCSFSFPFLADSFFQIIVMRIATIRTKIRPLSKQFVGTAKYLSPLSR